MPYSVKSNKTGVTYYLHSRETDSRGGKRRLFFFAKDIRDGAQENIPEGYTLTESPQTGLPLLKRVQ